MSLLEDRRVSWVPLSESGSGTDAESRWTPHKWRGTWLSNLERAIKLEGCLKKREKAHRSFRELYSALWLFCLFVLSNIHLNGQLLDFFSHMNMAQYYI